MSGLSRAVNCVGLDRLADSEESKLLVLVFLSQFDNLTHEIIHSWLLFSKFFLLALHPKEQFLLQIIVVGLQKLQIFLRTLHLLLALSQLLFQYDNFPAELLIIDIEFPVFLFECMHFADEV
jgi:hypothetical protein